MSKEIGPLGVIGELLGNGKIQLGLCSFDATNHQDRHGVYNDIASPFFGRFAGYQRRSDGFVIDIVE
jgi:hypothetical protein